VTHSGSATKREIFYNGGTLRALRDNLAFLPIAANAVALSNLIQNGGAIFDTQGFTISIGTPLLADGISTGGLTKLGAGTLIITNSAGNNFRGGTVVGAGTLSVGNNIGETAAALGIGRVTVSSGATLHFKPGSTATIYNFTNAFLVNGGTIIGEDGVQRLGSNSTFAVGPLGANVQATWGGKDVYIDGAISGDAGLNLAHGPTAGSAATIHIGSGASSYSGTVSVSGAGNGVTLSLDTDTGLQYAVVNLNPGTPGSLTVTPVGGATIAGLTGSGGTIRPAAVAGNYVLTIRSTNTFTYGGALVNNTGVLGLRKLGTGTQILSGASTATGNITVDEGTLALGTTGSVAGALVVGAGAVLDVSAKPTLTLGAGQALRGSGLVTGNVAVGATSQLRAGGVNTPGTLTVAGNLTLDSAYESVFDLTNSLAVGGGTNDLVVVTGDLDAGLGTIRINALAPLVSGTYRLMEYAGTEPLPFSGAVVGLNTRDAATLDETTPGQVNLIVTAGAAQELAWNPAVDGNWDYGTQNWLDAGTRSATEQFYDLDTVVFDDAGAFNNVVNVTTNLRPAAIYVTGGSNYTFSGAGTLSNSAAGPLVIGKDGPGTLTLANANGFTGGIVVSNGTLAAGAANALGGGPVTLLDGTILAAAGGNQTVSAPVVLAETAAELTGGGATLTVSGVVSGPGVLVKTGGDAVALTAANTVSNGVVVRAGTLYGGAAAAFGTTGTITVGDSGSDATDISVLLRHAVDITRPVVVTPNGSGTVRIGKANESGAADGTTFGGGLTLQGRPVTLVHAGNDRVDFGGTLTGTGDVVVVNADGGASRVSWTMIATNWTGNIIITGALARLQTFTANALADSSDVSIWGPGAALWVFQNDAIDAVNGDGSIIPFAANSTLTLGAGGGSGTFSGTISNNAANTITIIKTGAGTQTLDGPTVYSGNTEVWGGTLAFGPGSTMSSSTQFVVSNGATLDVTSPGLVLLTNRTLRGGGTVTGAVVATGTARLVPGSGGPGGTRETLTINGNLGLNATSTNFFNLGATTNAGGGFNDLVVIGGDLAPSNSVVRIDIEEPLGTGVYRLMAYGGTKVTSFNPALDLQGWALGRRGVALDESVANQINLVVTGAPADLVWLPQANGNWNYVDGNWSNTAAAALDSFLAGDAVTFDERGAYSNIVTLTTTNVAGLVTVTGTSNYTFQGAGNLAGSSDLLKSGAGELVLAATSRLAGVVRVDGGLLQVGNGGTAGNLLAGGGVMVTSGATLAYFHNVDFPIVTAVSGAGTWLVRGPGLGGSYSPTNINNGFSGSLVVTNARFHADRQTDVGGAVITVQERGQMYLVGGRLTNAMTVTGTGWQEGVGLLGAVRYQSAENFGPITLSGNARLCSYGTTSTNRGAITGDYQVDSWHNGYDLFVSSTNTFTNLFLNSGWWVGNHPGAFGPGLITFNGGGGLSAFENDLTITNRLQVNGTIYVGFNRNGTGRDTTFTAPWNLGAATRQFYVYNTNFITGTMTNGGLEVRQDGLLVLNGDIRVNTLHVNQNGANGNVRQDGGQVVVANAGGSDFRIGHWFTTGAYTMNGGVLSNAAGRISVGWDGAGTFTINGGTVYSPWIRMDENGFDSPGRLNLNGGTLVLGGGGLDREATGYVVNVNGGVLSAYSNWNSALDLNVNGTNGAAQINPAGYTITLHSVISGTGLVQQAGSGVLLLNGPYAAGPLSVLAGTLGGTGTVSSTVTVSGALRPGLAATAAPLTCSSVTFAAGAQVQPFTAGTSALLRVTGTDGLTLPTGAGVVTVLLANASIPTGTHVVIDYAGSLQGGTETNLVLGPLPPHMSAYLTNNVADTSIDLVVVEATVAVKWGGQSNTQWDINTTTNWVGIPGGAPTAYVEGAPVNDSVLFDDTAVSNFDVAVAVPVAPAAMTVSNLTRDYRIGGQPIGGIFGLLKQGGAALTLWSSNSFSGSGTLNGGTLRAEHPFALGSAGGALTLNTGVLALAADAPVRSKNVTLGGSITTLLERATAGTALTNTLGTFTFTAGNYTLVVAPGTNLSSGQAGLVYTGLWSGNTRTLTAQVEAGAQLAFVAGMPGGAQTVSVVKNGGGSLVLSGDNGTWDGGGLTLNGGTLELRHAQAMNNDPRRPLSATTGTAVRLVQDVATGFLVPTTVNGPMAWVSDRLTAGAGVTHVMNNLTINGDQVLSFAAGGAVTSGVQGLTFGAVTLAGNATLDVADPGTAADLEVTLGPVAGATFGFTKRGDGRLVLIGASTSAGASVISNGLVLVQGSLLNPLTVASGGTLGGTGVVRGVVTQDGVIAPGAGIGTLTISNQVTDGATSVYRFELGGTNAPTDYDQLVVSDVHTLQGALEVVVTNGYVPASGDRFVILTNSGLGGLLFGTFGSVSGPALDPGLGWEVQYVGTESASLVVTGTVGAVLTPYEQWAQAIPNPALRGEQADPDGDGYANLLEYSQGTDATNSSDNAKLSLVRSNGQFLVLFNRVNAATDIVYEVEGAYLPTNNATWLGIATNVIGSWGSSTNVNDNNTAAVHRVLVTDLEIGTNRSLRLKVTRP
jgi:fibronectin-binding autotransporter adhesin